MRVSLRTKQLGYALTTLGCLAGSALAVLAVIHEADSPVTTIASKMDAPAITADVNHAPSRDELVGLCSVPLRRPLYDPPPPPPEVKQLPPLQVEVLGTILEEANSVAIVRGGQGGMEYKRVGDTVGPADGPAKIIEIADSSITVERGGERLTLGVKSSEQR